MGKACTRRKEQQYFKYNTHLDGFSFLGDPLRGKTSVKSQTSGRNGFPVQSGSHSDSEELIHPEKIHCTSIFTGASWDGSGFYSRYLLDGFSIIEFTQQSILHFSMDWRINYCKNSFVCINNQICTNVWHSVGINLKVSLSRISACCSLNLVVMEMIHKHSKADWKSKMMLITESIEPKGVECQHVHYLGSASRVTTRFPKQPIKDFQLVQFNWMRWLNVCTCWMYLNPWL